MKNNDQAENNEKFEDMERRIAHLEYLVAQLVKPGTDKKEPIGDIPKISWENHLNIATISDIYTGKTSA